MYIFLQAYKSLSMLTSLLSALTIGLMITCIISVLIIVILSYYKNMFKKQEYLPDTAPADAISPSEVMSDEWVLEGIILLEGLFYCIVNVMLLGKWVKLKQNWGELRPI